MTWQVEREVNLRTRSETGNYYVTNQAESLPVDIIFHSIKEARKFVEWLNKMESWIERLELIVEYEANIEVDKLKENHFKEDLNETY